MLEEILLIYVLDLLYIALMMGLGLLFNTYTLKTGNNALLNLITGFFIVASTAAIITTHGITLAWGVWFVLFIMYIKRDVFTLHSNTIADSTNLKKDYIIAFILFTVCYISRCMVHYNYENGLSNIPYRDYVFYINYAEYFFKTGIENKLTSKNLLFDSLQFIEPYRFQDAWPMSVFMALTDFKSIDIYYLVLYPVHFFMASFAMYFVLRQFIPRYSSNLLILLAFLFLFYQSSNLWPYKVGVMMMGLAGYTKLWLHFTCIGTCLYLFRNKQLELGVGLLTLLFFTVPVTLAIPLFVVTLMIFTTLQNKKNTYYIFLSATFVLYAVYLWIGKGMEKEMLQIDSSGISVTGTLKSYIQAASYKALIISYILPSVCVYIAIRYFAKDHTFLDVRYIYIFALLCVSGYLAYIVLNNTNDAVQLFANIASPIGAVVSFSGILYAVSLIKHHVIRFIILWVFIGIGIYECGVAHAMSEHYARHDITRSYDRHFIEKCREVLHKKTTNPVGIYYPTDGYGMVSEQHVREIGYNMTLLLGRYYDVVNIKGDSVLFDENRYKKIDRDWHRMAVNIYAKKNKISTNKELDFIKGCKIQYLITFRERNTLPDWLSHIITEELKDPKSGLYLYILNPVRKNLNESESVQRL
jgi:hypothetical protein